MDGLVSAATYNHALRRIFHAGNSGEDTGLAKTSDGRWQWGLCSIEFARGGVCNSRVPIQTVYMGITRAPRFRCLLRLRLL